MPLPGQTGYRHGTDPDLVQTWYRLGRDSGVREGGGGCMEERGRRVGGMNLGKVSEVIECIQLSLQQ